MSGRVKAIDRLLNEGFFQTRDEALPYLMGGAVTCGPSPVRNGGQLVPLDQSLAVRGLHQKYVGKGGYKLEGAIEDFRVAVESRVCIDAGACTGGFTDCLLQHGAERVYAVEAGFGQLAGSLAQNAGVVNLERTNLGDAKLLKLDPAPTLGSVDLSYLSLTGAVPQYRVIMHSRGELLCLVKPLFETDNAEARRTGKLTEEAYAPLLYTLIANLNAQEETSVIGVTHSHVTGNGGTREFFLHVAFGGVDKPDLTHDVEAAVSRALELDKYRREC